MSTPRISVAMSVYNGERFLAEAIESILSQSFTDFEFLILDDGSRDSSCRIAESYAARDARVRVISRENRGLVASLNQLVDEARAPLIARMDADDIARPERFARQVAWLAEHPYYGVVGTWSEDIDTDGKPYPTTGAEHPLTHEDFLKAIDAGTQLLCHPAVTFRRDVVRSVGGYHAAFRHCEDLDLWLRLASVTKLGNIPERLIRYRHYPEQVSSRHATEQQIGAAVARIAYEERAAGRPDPTVHLAVLPPIDKLDALFGRGDIGERVLEKVSMSLRYSSAGMADNGFDLLLEYLRRGGTHDGMWRTAARLVRFGYPVRALKLAGTLATTARPANDRQSRIAPALEEAS
ncbi:MAG: glycosyltransferase [Novosphingobium sp.]|nr:glycosyltransferase [Novosphingobium sp.]